jgi:glycosyltransferase involved in cell wall biosynthesis
LKRRILWLAKGLGPGGMERLLVTHASAGDRDRFEYFAAYLVERPHSVVRDLERLGVRCTRFGDGRGADPRWVLELRRFVRHTRIDLVHIHSPMVAALARPALLAMRQRPAVVYTEHNSWDCYAAATRFANAATYALDDAQLAVSAAAARSVATPFQRNVEVLTHGIDVQSVARRRSLRDEKRAELGVGSDVIVVITVANLRHEKGYDVLLDAAAVALAKRADLLFLSVGHGQLASEMEDRRRELGLGERFRFLGFRDDVHGLLAAADVFCLASRHEGLPVALMEAYAIGLPVVATRVGGLPEVVEDGGSGVLVEPDDPDALAHAILAVAADESRRRKLATRAAELAGHFDAGVTVRRIEAVYDKVSR